MAGLQRTGRQKEGAQGRPRRWWHAQGDGLGGSVLREARMSITDYEIEPEDDEFCSEHTRYKPCRICRDEAAEFIAEAMREGGRDGI